MVFLIPTEGFFVSVDSKNKDYTTNVGESGRKNKQKRG
jgi:hypothetical protein